MSPKNTMMKLFLATAPIAVQGLNLSYTFGLKPKPTENLSGERVRLQKNVRISQSFYGSLGNLKLHPSLSEAPEIKQKIFDIVQELANANRCTPGPILGSGTFGVVVSCEAKKYEIPRVAKIPLKCDSWSQKVSEYEGAIHERLSEQQKNHMHYVPERFASFIPSTGCPVEIMEGGTPITTKHVRQSPSWFLEQAAASLQFLHANGIVHMDFKEENTVMLRDGRLALIDFGISGITGRSLKGARGTFIAPELYKSEFQISGKIDIYSLGIQMVRSLVPSSFGTGTKEEMIRTDADLRLEANNPDYSPDIRRLLQLVIRMIDEDVGRRPSARHVVETLRGKMENIQTFVDRPMRDVTEIWGRVDVEGVKALARLRDGLPQHLKGLVVEVEVEVHPEDSAQEEKKKALQSLLSNLPANLEVLKLSGFEIYGHTGRLLETNLKRLTNLRELDLSGNDMDAGIVYKVLHEVLPALEKLNEADGYLNLPNHSTVKIFIDWFSSVVSSLSCSKPTGWEYSEESVSSD